jgi:hypothetical protein
MSKPSAPSTLDYENEEVLAAHLIKEARDERPAYSAALHARICGELDGPDRDALRGDHHAVQIAKRKRVFGGDVPTVDAAAPWLSPAWSAALGVALMALSVLVVLAVASREFSSRSKTGGELPIDTVVTDDATQKLAPKQPEDALVVDRQSTGDSNADDAVTPKDPDTEQQLAVASDDDNGETLLGQLLPTTGFLDESLPEIPLPDVSRFDPDRVMDEQVRQLRSDGELVVSLLMSPLSWAVDDTDTNE